MDEEINEIIDLQLQENDNSLHVELFAIQDKEENEEGNNEETSEH